MVKRLDTLLCEISDMDRAVAFYTKVFGQQPTLATPHWSSFQVGGVTIGLHPQFSDSASTSPGGWVLGVEVDDLELFRAELATTDSAVGEYHEVPGGVILNFQDPDGNRLQAIQRGLKISDLAN